jgi:ATP-binding cassette, subfamily F, member 3
MSILTAQDISKSFGPDEIFSGITVQIPHNAKIALVGPNGAGKTTLLNILIGQDSPSSGMLHTKKGLTMGFLPQRPHFDSDRTIWDEMLTAFEHVLRLQENLRELEHAMADPARKDEHDDLLEQYGKLQQNYEDAGGYTYEQDIKRVLHGLGFAEDELTQPLALLSGGQKTRALLARLLLERPDLLVLDEPTNHLDIAAVEWLEGYLRSMEGSLLLVSHDRYFMDRVVDTVWELDFGGIETYSGNYSHYVQQREERYERLMKEYEAQQEFIEKEQEYIRKHIASQNTNQAKGRRRRLERMMSSTDRRGRAVEDQWLIKKPRTRKQVKIHLESIGRTGNEVLRVQDLGVGYDDDPLFMVDDILLLRQEVAAIIGPNGAGKSTFLKTILGKLKPTNGRYHWGSNVRVGYFAQAHENLDENKTLLDELLSVRNLPISEARNYLAQYLFTGDDVYREVSTLSGGERGRLALAKLSLLGTNVLLLDEPTNHLDIAAQEVLQNVLAGYEGTILMVSHDRYIIDALASQIWRIEGDVLEVFKGSYTDYVDDRDARQAAEVTEHADVHTKDKPKSVNGTKKQHPSGLNPYERRKRIEALESEIHRLEAEMSQLSADLEQASAAGNVAEVTRLGEAYSAAESTLDERMTEWANLA